MLGDQIVDVEADSDEEAQNIAFAKIVRELKPQHFTVWETSDEDVWAL